MQFVNHDFYSNFTSSLKSGDLGLSSDILSNEISDFIVFETSKIVGAMNKAGVKITEKETDEEIVDAILSELNTNEKLQNALAFIIADGNELINTKGGADKQKQIDTVKQITAGLKKTSKEIGNNVEDFKKSTMNQIESKAAARKEYKRIIWKKDGKSNKAGLYLALAGAGIMVLVIFVYIRQKRQVSKAIPNMIMGNGGGIGDFNNVNSMGGQMPMNNMNVSQPIPTNVVAADVSAVGGGASATASAPIPQNIPNANVLQPVI